MSDEDDWAKDEIICGLNRDSGEKKERDYKAQQNGKSKERCFVAGVIYVGMASSSAYCGEEVEQVRVLREYRDNVLMKSYFGRKIVGVYYGIGSERIASFIEKKARFLIPIIRKGLDFIVEDYEIRKRS